MCIRDSATALHARDLIREATILASLAPHPHVVRLRACAAPDVAPFVVVDLVDDASVDLEKRLREARDRNSQGLDWSSAPRWTAETGLDVAVQLGRAVAHLHGGAVLHRDLKPANVVPRSNLRRMRGCRFLKRPFCHSSRCHLAEVVGNQGVEPPSLSPSSMPRGRPAPAQWGDSGRKRFSGSVG